MELTRRTGRKEGSLQDTIGEQTAFLPRPAGEAGRGGHVGELQRSCRNSNPVANILESSNQRDRLSRNVLVNTTLTVPGFENTAAPLKSGLEVRHLPVLFSSEACNEKRFQTVFFKKQQTNKKTTHKLLLPRHIFTHGFFYTKDTEYFLHSAEQLTQFFVFFF